MTISGTEGDPSPETEIVPADLATQPEEVLVSEEIRVVLDTLRGADYFGKLSNGHNLADLLQTVYDHIVSADEQIHGFNRTAEFVSRYMAFGKTMCDNVNSAAY